MPTYHCKYCTHKPFRSRGGLKQHYSRTSCGKKHDLEHGNPFVAPSAASMPSSQPPITDMEVNFYVPRQPLNADQLNKNADKVNKFSSDSMPDKMALAKAHIEATVLEDQRAWSLLSSPDAQLSSPHTPKHREQDQKMPAIEHANNHLTGHGTSTVLFQSSDEEDMFSLADDATIDSANTTLSSVQFVMEIDNDVNDEEPTDHSIRDQFREYVTKQWNCLPLDGNQIEAIKLLDILKRKKASLDTYEEIMVWHLMAKGELRDGQKLSEHLNFQG